MRMVLYHSPVVGVKGGRAAVLPAWRKDGHTVAVLGISGAGAEAMGPPADAGSDMSGFASGECKSCSFLIRRRSVWA